MSDLMEVLKGLDEEYGIGDVPDGIYHVALGPNTKVYRPDNGNEPRFRFGWKIACGDQEGRELGDFQRWFVDSEAQLKPARGSVIQLATAIGHVLVNEGDETAQNAIVDAVGTIQSAPDGEATLPAFQAIADTFGERTMYVRATTAKSGYQNVRYTDKGDPVTGECACTLSAVSV